MATVGNLFVNIGASTQGLERGTKRAGASVRSMRKDIVDALADIPGLSEFTGPANAIEKFADMLSRASAAAQTATSTTNKMVDAKARLAAATEKAQKAEADLAAGAKLTRLLYERDKSAEKMAKLTPHLEAAASAYQAQEARINAAAFRGAAYNAMLQKQARLLAKLNALKAQQAAIQAEINRKEGLAGRTQQVLRSRGVTVKADGSVNMQALQKSAAGANDRVAALRGTLTSGARTIKQFASLSVTSAMGLGILAAGAIAAVGGLMSLTKSMAKMAAELSDQATALGVLPSRLQTLRDSYLVLGVAPEAAERSIQTLGATLQDAIEGGEEASKKFTRLGLDVNALATQDSVAALDTVMARIRQLGTQGEKIKSLRDLFGKQGLAMAAAVNATATDLAEAASIAASLKLPDEMIRRLDKTSEHVDALGRAFDNVKMMLASAFGPALEVTAIALRNMLTSDFTNILGGMQSVAFVVALIGDALAFVVNLFRVIWNILQAIGGVLLGLLTGAIGGILKVVQLIVRGMEFIAGSSTELSDRIGQAAAEAFGTTVELAKGVGADLGEAVTAGIDSVVPDMSAAVLKGIVAGYDSAAKSVAASPIAVSIEDKAAAEKLKSVAKQMDSLREKAATLGMSERETELFRLQRDGATPEQLAEADALLRQVEAFEAQKKVVEEIKSIMADLQQQADTALMTERQKLEYKLRQAGADDQAIRDALLLNAAIEERTQLAEGQKAWADFMSGLDKSLLDATASREQQVRKLAEAAGLLGADLDAAVSKALAMEEAIAQAEKTKQQQEDIGKTLQGMRDEVRRAQIGESAFAREQFAGLGATAAQLEEFDRLQAGLSTEQVAKPDGIIDTIETAFGGLRIGQSPADEMLSESVQQTDLLNRIASATESAAAATNARPGVSGGGMDSPLAVEANKYLAQIATNTAAFVGVLN